MLQRSYNLSLYLFLTDERLTVDVAVKPAKRKDNAILIKLTVLFSTVLKPTSEILGSLSPRSKAHKTLVASENIPRSVRIRTCHEMNKKKTHMDTFIERSSANYREC